MHLPGTAALRRWTASPLLAVLVVPGGPAVVRAAAMPEPLAVIVNNSDPLSRAIGTYHVERRDIRRQNLIAVEFPPGRDALVRDLR